MKIRQFVLIGVLAMLCGCGQQVTEDTPLENKTVISTESEEILETVEITSQQQEETIEATSEQEEVNIEPDTESIAEQPEQAKVVRTPYELEYPTQLRYENKSNGYITLPNLPQNDEEAIVALDLINCIDRSFSARGHYEYHPFDIEAVPTQTTEMEEEIEEEKEEIEEIEGPSELFEWVQVHEIKSLTYDELLATGDCEETFHRLAHKQSKEITVEEYVKVIMARGCKVVRAVFTDKYTPAGQYLQGGDGEHEIYWLFVPDENGQLRVFEVTDFFTSFNFWYPDDIPDVLRIGRQEKEVTKRTPYELEYPDQLRYENEQQQYITFTSAPQNDEEAIVMLDLVKRIIKDSTSYEYYDEKGQSASSQLFESNYQWIQVSKVQSLTQEEVLASGKCKELFSELAYEASPLFSSDRYMPRIMKNGCKVVRVVYTDQYEEQLKTLASYLPDGEHEEYYLLVLDEHQQLRIYDSTRYCENFTVGNSKDIPRSLRARNS